MITKQTKCLLSDKVPVYQGSGMWLAYINNQSIRSESGQCTGEWTGLQ